MNTTDLKKFASAREVFLTIIVVVFVFIVFFKMLYNPKSEQLDDIKKQMTDLTSQQTALKQQIDALKLKQSQKQETIEKTDNIKVKILKREIKPKVADSVSMIDKIVDLGSQEGLVFDSMSSKQLDSKITVSRLNINMQTHGPFNAITNFLKKLDTIQALFVIDSLAINSDPTKNVEATLDAKATLFQIEGVKAKDASK